MGYGLVLEGGAMRGLFTAGVLDVMMEKGVSVDGAIGVSAGAAFGCNYKSRQIGRAARYNIRFCGDKRYCSISSLIKTGDMFGADFCYNKIPYEYDSFDLTTYNENPMEFYVVCTDVDTGKAVYRSCPDGEDSILWMRASASMPLAARIVEIEGKLLLDGGVADSVPLRYFEGIGYEKNVVVLTQPRGYTKKKNYMMPVIRLKYRRYKDFVQAMADRHKVYNESIAYAEKRASDGAALIVRPPEKLPVGRVEKDPEKLKAAYEIGRRTAEAMLPQIREFLGH